MIIYRNAGDAGGAAHAAAPAAPQQAAAAPAGGAAPAEPAPAPAVAPSPAGGAPAAAPAAAPAVEKPKWLAQVAPDIRDHPDLQGLASLNDAAKSLIELKGKLPRAIIAPTKDSTPEERAAFLEAMGIPHTPDGQIDANGYPVDAAIFEGFPADVQKSLADFVKAAAADGAMTGKQAANMAKSLKAYLTAEANQRAAELKAKEESFETKVLDMFSGDKGKADAMKALYRKHLVRLGSEEAIQVLAGTGAIFDPSLAKAFAEIEAYIGDDEVHRTAGVPAAPAAKPQQNSGFSHSKEWDDAYGNGGK